MAADLGFEATELRLGLPGGGGGGGEGEVRSSTGKRGFSETIDLKLKLEPAAAAVEEEEEADKEDVVADESSASGKMKRSPSQSSVVTAAAAAQPDPAEKPRAPKYVCFYASPPIIDDLEIVRKAQVVGWPPVRSYRKNIMSVQTEKSGKDVDGGDKSSSTAAAAFVKVSLDGAPYLRKVDLKMYKSYQELSKALEKMFSSFTIGSCGSQGMNGMNESKLVDLLNGSEYVPTYEDKDGDWMLVGDVPWEMFVESCKRLRIMKGSEAIGLGEY
ncbi:hypothetical protein PR202_gb24172 [Eleusine coracana subsp. coracana]|uniref:Auxin-responsive protein n=1 Tax=Eleusine coracana subsp. coracana TaxID=191504 RepID=A0AAV5FLA8_ELECO|nr:hypothetical protein PR202_gb24172 [Eleusine coracana subsp. coracana]